MHPVRCVRRQSEGFGPSRREARIAERRKLAPSQASRRKTSLSRCARTRPSLPPPLARLGHGLNRSLMGQKVSYSSVPLASVYAAALGLISVVCALRAKRRGIGSSSSSHSGGVRGGGDMIVVPLASALHDALVHNSIDFGEVPPRYQTPRRAAIKALSAQASAEARAALC